MSQNVTGPGAAKQKTEDAPSLFIPMFFITFVIVLLAATVPFLTTTPSMMKSMPSNVGGFHLVDGRGQAVSDRSWPGKFLLVYFGYTHCPDLCPTMLANLTGALNILGSRANRIQPLFVTVDPQRDTPAVMKQYTALFSPRIEGLTGAAANLAETAQEYEVRYARQKTGPGPGDYEMEHSAFVYLVYPSGDLALTIPPGQSPAQMASELASQLN